MARQSRAPGGSAHLEPGPPGAQAPGRCRLPGSHLRQEESSARQSPRWWLGGRAHEGGLPTGERGVQPPWPSPTVSEGGGLLWAGQQRAFVERLRCKHSVLLSFRELKDDFPVAPTPSCGWRGRGSGPPPKAAFPGPGESLSHHRRPEGLSTGMVRVAQVGKCRRLSSC